jgi:hypothetical protein
MLDQETKRRIDTARDILVGKLPNPQAQVEQITIAMIYKFMDDMDKEAMEFGLFYPSHTNLIADFQFQLSHFDTLAASDSKGHLNEQNLGGSALPYHAPRPIP